MSSYLERYERGEREQVWQELVDLGAAVRHEPVAGDARAVANEITRRARHNVALLVERLHALDYQFEVEHPRARTLDIPNMIQNIMSQAEAQGASLPPGFGNQLQQMAETMHRQMAGVFDQMKQALQQDQPAQGDASTQRDYHRAWVPADDAFRADVAELDQTYGPLPLVLRAWYDVVGEVNFMGDHPQLNCYYDDGPASDPLVVFYDGDGLVASIERDPRIGGRKERLYTWDLAPDACHKANQSGGGPTCVKVPNPCFDAPLISDDEWDGMYFVPYLRTCFQWGGFPGLQRHPDVAAATRDIVTFLTRDLLPL